MKRLAAVVLTALTLAGIAPVAGASAAPVPRPPTHCWVAGWPGDPEACLVNFYAPSARMGLHVDSDEQEIRAPVVSVSLGASCLFRYGGTKRNDPTKSVRLESGDVVVIGGPSRLCYHGVDRLYPGTSTLVANDARINLTMRRVSPADIA